MQIVKAKRIEPQVINSALYIFLGLIPIVDMINGYNLLENNSIGSLVGVVFRIVSILFLFFLIIQKNRILRLVLLNLFILFIFLVVYINYFRTKNVNGLIDEAMYATKLILPILYALGISNAVNNGIVDEDIVDKILTFFSFLVPLTLIVPMILNLGYSSYDLGGGYKGFYYSNNELNILMISITIFNFWQLTAHKKKFFFIPFLLNSVSMLLIGSKTSILCVLLLGMIYFFRKISIQSIIKILIVLTILIFLGSRIFSEFFDEIIFRFQYYYTITNGSDNIFNFLLSNRNLRIVPTITEVFLTNKSGFLNFIFGYGHYQQFDPNVLQSIMEMDFVDTIIWYGVVVTAAVLGFYIYVLIRGIKRKADFVYILIYITIFSFSIVAGHVLYSALAGGIFGIIGSRLLHSDSKIKNNH
ncbi:hypothetical protein [Enterococcus xiangfangensis]|uniref:hypothetical protein n=1 Tax=Enterococcus xiangfangensis TaxID=1296537 RepID=UPI003D18079C|nr:hypothetical protein [Enterococcus asini]